MNRYRRKTFSLKEEKGSLLLILLFLTAVLMVSGAALLKNAFNERMISENYLYKIKAHYLAEAGVELALSLLGEGLEPFLQLKLNEPFYLQKGVEEEYFILQWLEPGSPAGDEQYYTLVSRGVYRHNQKNRVSEAQIRVLLDLIQGIDGEEDTMGNNDENNKENDGNYSERVEKFEFILISLSGR